MKKYSPSPKRVYSPFIFILLFTLLGQPFNVSSQTSEKTFKQDDVFSIFIKKTNEFLIMGKGDEIVCKSCGSKDLEKLLSAHNTLSSDSKSFLSAWEPPWQSTLAILRPPLFLPYVRLLI